MFILPISVLLFISVHYQYICCTTNTIKKDDIEIESSTFRKNKGYRVSLVQVSLKESDTLLYKYLISGHLFCGQMQYAIVCLLSVTFVRCSIADHVRMFAV